MASITFDSFNLQDINGTGVITSNLIYRNIPNRNVETEKITRRPGVRILNDEFAEKRIQLEGFIFGNSIQDLQDKIDALHVNVTSKGSGMIVVDNSRSATAIVTRLNIPEEPYNTDFVPFSMEMLMADPFFYGSDHSVSLVLASGTNAHTVSITVSGSYYMYPTFTITLDGTSGSTPINYANILYGSTGESVTWSGSTATPVLDYGDTLQFDFNEQTIIKNITSQNSAGAFANFEPGERTITITFSGSANWIGGTLDLSYQPRYL